MPKFLRIGLHQSNVSGYTSKAWCVRRVGSAVFLKWGAVEVQGAGKSRKVYWSRLPQEKTIRCGSDSVPRTTLNPRSRGGVATPTSR